MGEKLNNAHNDYVNIFFNRIVVGNLIKIDKIETNNLCIKCYKKLGQNHP